MRSNMISQNYMASSFETHHRSLGLICRNLFLCAMTPALTILPSTSEIMVYLQPEATGDTRYRCKLLAPPQIEGQSVVLRPVSSLRLVLRLIRTNIACIFSQCFL